MRTCRARFWIAAVVAACAGCDGASDDGSAGAAAGSSVGGSGGGECTPEADEELCASAGVECGTFTTVDRCGQSRSPACGTCEPPNVCGGAGIEGQCGPEWTCEPETDAALCEGAGKDCDEVTLVDSCGTSRTIDCGSCLDGLTCGGGGTANVCGGELGWCQPSTTVPSGWSFLYEGTTQIGVNLDHGAAIGHFSTGGTNVLDSNDTGRYLQQSFYGNEMGGSWHGEPWPFNPVQGGSAGGDPSPVTEFCNNGATLYAKTIPMDWGDTGITPCVMEEWIELDGDVAIIRFRFEYQGNWDNAARHQEVPALFVNRDLERLTSYVGGSPWTGGALTSILPNQLETDGNQYIAFDEPWLAFLNANDWGMGLYKRDETQATCYRYGDIGDGDATSYFAFLDTFALTPGLVHDYTLYAKIGQVNDLRAAFQQLYESGL